jgi:RNase P subunit RPR2
MSSPAGPPPASPLLCGKCKVPLVLGKVMATYLGSEFPIELWKCPGCGKILVPESLATGKMLQVEQALEDK